jgi:hypothetical protein
LAAEFFEVREEFVFDGSGGGDQFLHLFASDPEGFQIRLVWLGLGWDKDADGGSVPVTATGLDDSR